MEQVKTVGLLTFLTIMFVMIGSYFGGQNGMMIALLMAGVMNFYAYFYSDKMVLAHYNAVEVDRVHASGLFDIVERLTAKAGIPMPRIYIIPEQSPNAFATGRNPEHAAVAVTEGLLELLNEEEVEAVIAHELSHVRHYDILIGTIAATFAGAISFIANMMQWGAFFGGGRDREGGGNPIVMLLLAIVLPIAAMIIQMSVSRSREYLADEGAARLTGHPEWLQSALLKLENYAKGIPLQQADTTTAHMFIINPLSGKNISMADLFRTHPNTEERIARLEELKSELGSFSSTNSNNIKYDRRFVRKY